MESTPGEDAVKIVEMTTKDLDYINLVDKAARLIKDLEYYIHLVHKAAAGFERIDSNFFLINLFVYLFMAALGLRCCTQAFSNCGEQGLPFVVVHGLLIVVASLVAEHGL